MHQNDKHTSLTLVSNKQIARDVYAMRLIGNTDALTAPGQFVNLSLPGFFLRRPISVADWDIVGLDIVYKILGKGTAAMTKLPVGYEMDTLVGLGNGFSPEKATSKTVVLIGGGVGAPPLYRLAKELVAAGNTPTVALGFAAKEDVFFQKEFEDLGCDVHIATEDGSAGTKGFVTAILQNLNYGYYFACGPNAMLRAVYTVGQEKGAEGQLSFEERMGCGYGACMGCSCKTNGGFKRVCYDGPVFTSGEVIFE